MRTLPTPVSITTWGGSWLHLNKHNRDFLHEIFQQVFLQTPGLWLELETDPDYHKRWEMSLSSPRGESVHNRVSGMNERLSVSSPVTILPRAVWSVNLSWLTVTLSLSPQAGNTQNWPIRDQNLVTWGQLTLLILNHTSLSRQSRDIRVTRECDRNINHNRK